MQGIYKITSPSGAVYIGKSIEIDKRWKSYRKLNCEAQPLIYYSLLKHGVGSHVFEVIEEGEREELSALEYKWWKYYDDKDYKMLNCRVPMYDTIPDNVAAEIERQELETLIVLRIRTNLLEKRLIETGRLKRFII